MRKIIRSCVLVASLLSGWSATALAESTMVGIWFSPFQPNVLNVMSVIEFRADGTFRQEFRKCDDGEVAGYHTDSGTWSVSGDIEMLTVTRVNGNSVHYEDQYKILLLNESERRIQAEGESHIFVGHRVHAFEFPKCGTAT